MNWTWIVVTMLFSSCLGVPTFKKGGDKFEVQKSDQSCYLQLRVMCESGTRLSVWIGNHFARAINVRSSSTSGYSIQCIAVPCSENGKLPDDTMIIGNEVTTAPEDLHMSDISTFNSMVECKEEDTEEKKSVTVNCGTKNSQDIVEELALMQWQNSYDGHLKVQCGNRAGFARVRSEHDNGREDRVWQWDCANIATSDFDDCYWTGHENSYDLPLFFQCRANYILNGVDSVHDNGREDRIWKFRCCKAPNHFTKNCYITNFINNWDARMDHSATSTFIFTGAFSFHDNGKEDRRWRLEICQYQSCQ